MTGDFAANLQKRVKLEVGFDQSQNVSTRLNRLYFDFGIAIVADGGPELARRIEAEGFEAFKD